MQRLVLVLEDVLCAKRSGARVAVRDEQTAVVVNCAVFAHHQLDVIREECPGVEITFCDTQSSTTGFMLKVRLPPAQTALVTSESILLVVAFVACAATYTILLHA